MLTELLLTWQDAWRRAIAPQMEVRHLLALRAALAENDRRLVTSGTTVYPRPLQHNLDRTAEAACAIGFAGWQGDGLTTVKQVRDWFAEVAWRAGLETGDEKAVGPFACWFDDEGIDRRAKFRLLLAEVERSLVLLAAEKTA